MSTSDNTLREALTALLDEADRDEAIIISPGLSEYRVVEVGRLRALLAASPPPAPALDRWDGWRLLNDALADLIVARQEPLPGQEMANLLKQAIDTFRVRVRTLTTPPPAVVTVDSEALRQGVERLIEKWENEPHDPWYWSDAIEPLRVLLAVPAPDSEGGAQ